MNSDEKYAYAKYLQGAAVYHSLNSNHRMAIKYFVRSQEISNNLQGYASYKWTLFHNLAICNIMLGQVQETEKHSNYRKNV